MITINKGLNAVMPHFNASAMRCDTSQKLTFHQVNSVYKENAKQLLVNFDLCIIFLFMYYQSLMKKSLSYNSNKSKYYKSIKQERHQ